MKAEREPKTSGKTGQKEAVQEEKQPEKKYAKEQILSSGRYRGRRDLAAVLLRNEELYTISEIDSIIDEFTRKEVN